MLNITGFSTALFSTWLFIEQYGVLFDAGDGVSAGLGLKSRKAEHVFISHADRDHLAGLVQLHQLNADGGRPTIYYPRDCGSLPALRDFLGKFDPHVGPATWQPIVGDERIALSKNVFVLARENDHVHVADQVKSLDFLLFEEKRKLKSELQGMPGKQIARLRADHGEDFVTQPVQRRVLGYSGDTPQLQPQRWEGVEVLIHECTFLDERQARSAHANLPHVISSASQLALKSLILTHFSSRYRQDEIASAIRESAAKHCAPFPIFAVMPGELYRDILSGEPLWRPSASDCS